MAEEKTPMNCKKLIEKIPAMLLEIRTEIVEELTQHCQKARDRKLEDSLTSMEERLNKMNLLLYQLLDVTTERKTRANTFEYCVDGY